MTGPTASLHSPGLALRAAVIAVAAVPILALSVAAPLGAQATATLAVAQRLPVTGLDPAGASVFPLYPAGYEAAFLVYDGLVSLSEEMKIVPALATSWRVAADGRSWTFTIRPGVEFQDATALTAQAVADDLQRKMTPNTNPSNRTLWDVIESASAPDAGAVRIVTKEPHATLLNTLAHGSALIASPSAVARLAAQYRLHPVGTGPYAVGRWDVGRQLELVRNRRYWGPRPGFERIVLLAVPDAATRAAMVLSGEVQVAEAIPVEQLDDLRRLPGVLVTIKPGLRTFGMAINLNRPALQDLRVRQALNYAVDKELLVKALFGATASPLRSPLAPLTSGYVDLGPWPYDPPKARRLLDDAGWKPAPPIGVRVRDGARLEVTLLTPQGVFPRDVEVVETLADYLRNVGFEPHFMYLGPLAFHDQLLIPPDRYRWDLVLFGFNPSNGEGGYQLNALYRSNPDHERRPRAWNVTWYANPAVDAWLTAGDRAADPQARVAAYGRVERRVWEDAPYLWLYASGTTVVTRGVRGVAVLPTAFTILRSAAP